MGRTQTLGDKLAIALSSLCVIHCLATPLLLIILPSFGALFADSHELFHQIILFFVLPVGLAALAAGYRHHHKNSVLGSGLTGLAILFLTALYGHDYLGEFGETGATILASLVIAYAHLRNYQLSQKMQKTSREMV